ncbi:MAG: PhzF family phenazine biosynthesis protein [Pseudomonadota bacterium]
MNFDLYQVDAFADRVLRGNPAAVAPLDAWPTDDLLQAVAVENNLSETAYTVRFGPGRWALRWFTPAQEVPLCGHATLATAHILWTEGLDDAETLVFETLSGDLTVERAAPAEPGAGGAYVMDFPADPPVDAGPIAGLTEALGAPPTAVLRGQYVLAIYDDPETVLALAPDMGGLAAIAAREGGITACVVASAAGGRTHDGAAVDFISRFFAPAQGIPEDPVTGSAHCVLAPYWAGRLGKDDLAAFQASARGGVVGCRVAGDRVVLRGDAVTFLRGRVSL